MKTKYAYSPSRRVFLMTEWKENYVAAGSWPDDAIDVSNAVFDEFSAPVPGKVYGPGADNMPVWSDEKTALTPEQMTAEAKAKQQALISDAAAKIAPLRDASDGGYIRESDKPVLVAWQKYRYALTTVDTEVLPAVFPDPPFSG